MTDINITKRVNRDRRHARTRAKVSGTAERPRVAVFKSNQHVFIQAIDDTAGRTLASGTEGKAFADTMKKKGITTAVFDVSGFKYHGRVKEVADALREAREQSSEMVGAAERRASAIAEEARAEANRIISQAREAAEQEAGLATQRAREGLREQVAQLAVAGAEKILRREVNAQAHADLLTALKKEL